MATTFSDLITQVLQQIEGYSKNQDAMASLAASMTATDTTFTVDSTTVTNLSRGMAEIDEELILIKSFDSMTGVVTVLGGVNGRGYRGTTAATHSINALITNDPPFPRKRIKEAINDTINAMYPDLQIFATTEITKLAPVYEYEMPAAAKDVWYVVAQLVGPTKIWQPMTRWRFNPNANTTAFPSGKSIELWDFVTPGRPQRVVYVKEPSNLVNLTDDFATVTGYPERVTDIVKWGACARLLPAYEAARLQQVAVESTERASLVPTSSAAKAAAYFSQLYYQRLAEERRRQWEEIPNFQRFQS
jgi:hypothetical protein